MAANDVIECIGPSYRLDDRKAAVQTAINCYMEQIEGLGEMRQLTQVSVPGMTQIGTLAGAIRGMRSVNGRLFVVAGPTFYEVSTTGVATIRGSVTSENPFVGMAHNSTQLCLTDGSNGYVFNLASNVFTTISSPGWQGSFDVAELDGYGIFIRPKTDQFYISKNDDFSTFNAIDFSSADSQPDSIVTQRVLHRELWLMGETSTEIWVNSGDISFPFVRYNSVTLDIGIVGKRAAIVAADSIMWIGKTTRGSGIVYLARGHQPQRVSTRAVEQALAKSTDLSAATMWAYQVDGHEFIGINAPGLPSTWVYDAAIQQWHERAEWSAGWQQGRVSHVCSHSGLQIVGDATGKLYTLSQTVYTNGTDPLVRERTWPHKISPSMQPISFHILQLACTTGYGGTVTLEISNDGGMTFGPPLLRSLGAIGRFMQRIRWMPLGTAFDRVFRIRCSDAVPFNMHAAMIDTQ